MSPPNRSIEFYRKLPKIELHRHLEGSLRFETVQELARDYGLDLPSTAKLRELVQIQQNEPLTFENFLSKFATVRLFFRSPEIITRITREAVEDAARDNVRYMELRFTPAALSRSQDFSLSDVMDWVIEGTQQADREFGITTRLIASVNRHEDVDLAAQVAELAAKRIDSGIIGLDLAGNEAEFQAYQFEKIFHQAAQDGLHITVHAGEWGPGENVYHAIEKMGAERIAHGIRVLESPEGIKVARERQTVFEVCITSNYQSGAISNLERHPLREMLEAGLNVTINTDDPGISQICLSDEYWLACEMLDFSLEMLSERVFAAAQATFLSEPDRYQLIEGIAQEFNQVAGLT